MDIDFRNKTIDDRKYNVIDMWVNGVSIDSVSQVKINKTCNKDYDMIIFITSDDVEHHVQKKSIIEVVGTFYDENWCQLSGDEMNIMIQLKKQFYDLEEV